MTNTTTINKQEQWLPAQWRRPTSLKISVSRIAVSTAAVLLVVSSAGFGALFAWRTGSRHDVLLGVLSVAMALGLELSKPFAIAGAFTSLRAFRPLTAAALIITGVLAIGYSLQAELTFQAMTRGDLVAERAGEAGSGQKAEARYRRAEAELATLEPARPAAALQPQLDALLALPGVNGCTALDGPQTTKYCPRVATLRAELGRAQRRADLDKVMREAEQDEKSAPVVSAADPGATALTTYLAALGYVVPADRLTLWLPLLGVLALEIGAAFAVVLVRATAERDTPAPAMAGNIAARAAENGTPAADPPDAGTPKNGAHGKASQRQLAKLIGVGKSTVNRRLKELAKAGEVILDCSKAGTQFHLI